MIAITQIKDSLGVRPETLQLHPLYEPEAVGFSFETIGWKVLAVVLLLTLLLVGYILFRNYRINAYRRQAIIQLDQVGSLTDVFVILKVVAIQSFGRETVGGLYGKPWLEFLDARVSEPLFAPYQKSIEQLIYKGENPSSQTSDEIKLNSKKWIKTHAREL